MPYARDGLPPQTGTPAVQPTSAPNGPAQPGSLSEYLAYPRTCSCAGPIGGDGPIGYELYLRSGVSIPVGGAIFGDVLETGWAIEGGARTLLFNPDMSAAWTFNLGILFVTNHGQRPDIRVPLSILVPQNPDDPVTFPDVNGNFPPVTVNFGIDPGVPGVTIRNLSRTFLNLGVGREWWLARPACADGGWGWRLGVDTGGRWGSSKLDHQEIRHRRDTIGGVWVAGHTDLEIPCGCCVFQAGFRAEWAYTWSDILQGSNADMQEVLLLFNTGVRY
jgi:hypothetical protein